jgi:hypothetical protein
MMAVSAARSTIKKAAMSWPGVTVHPHRFGAIEFRLGRREIGHLHGDSLLDVPLPTRVRDQVVADGRAEPHHILPDSGWVSLHLGQEGDLQRAVDLLRLSYDLAVQQKARREAR